jgi:hypothetical protein
LRKQAGGFDLRPWGVHWSAKRPSCRDGPVKISFGNRVLTTIGVW